MNKDLQTELQEKANQVFKSHPDEVVVYVTEDKQCFVEANLHFCKGHASSKGVDYVKFKRATKSPKNAKPETEKKTTEKKSKGKKK